MRHVKHVTLIEAMKVTMILHLFYGHCELLS